MSHWTFPPYSCFRGLGTPPPWKKRSKDSNLITSRNNLKTPLLTTTISFRRRVFTHILNMQKAVPLWETGYPWEWRGRWQLRRWTCSTWLGVRVSEHQHFWHQTFTPSESMTRHHFPQVEHSCHSDSLAQAMVQPQVTRFTPLSCGSRDSTPEPTQAEI